MSIKNYVLGFAGAALLASGAQAALMAQWTFETSVPASAGPHTAEAGLFAGTSGASGATGGTYSNPVGNGSAESFSSNDWNVGEYYQFTTSTVGYEDVRVSFSHISSSTGPRDFELQYSNNGTSFTSAGAYVVINNSSPNNWNSTTPIPASVYNFDLSAVTALDNQSQVWFRLVNTSTLPTGTGSAVAPAGASRVDDFTVTANPIPEPATLGVLASLSVVALRRRSAR